LKRLLNVIRVTKMKGNETAAPVIAFDRAYFNGQFVTPHGRRGFSGYRNTWNLKPSSANREIS
jgi:hypothetical protein